MWLCHYSSDCGEPEQTANGNVTWTGTTLEHTATYSCIDGYELVGPTERYCQSNGNWTSNPPQCNIIGKI